MYGLAVVLLAAPGFGLSLTPPSVTPALSLQIDHTPALIAAASDDNGDATAGVGDASTTTDAGKEVDQASDDDDYTAQLKRRNALIKIHRPLGIATWIAMTATVVLGTIQYYNLYGFFDDIGHNPCVEGHAIFGQGQCSGTPWPHLLAAGVTTGLYAATFTVSLMMPDPDDLANGKGEFARTLRMHKLLRWVHFGGMLAQLALGIVIANGVFDRANNYKTLQMLATAHLATGIITYGALTWAGALMTF